MRTEPRSQNTRRCHRAVAHVLHRDIETRSTVGLKKVGALKYAADATTEVLCVAYAADNQPPQLWVPGDPVPPEFLEASKDPSWIVVAHNDAFESAIEQHVLSRVAWPIVRPSAIVARCRCASLLGCRQS